jgi:hypothetical protein
MARNKGTFSYAANYEVKIQALLDPRGGVDTKEELINKETFPYDGDTIYMKEGMLVTVSSTQEVYMLVSLANILATDYSGWKRVDAGAVTPVEIVDNLTSDATDKALSAKQGKELKSEIDGVKAKVTSIYTPKGSVDSYDKLPTENLTAGDVYNVVAAYGNYPAGTNWAWTGTEWDALGGNIDLSNYYNKSEVEGKIKEEADRADAEEKRLAGLIDGVSGVASGADNKASQALSLAQQNETNIASLNLVLNGNNNPDDDITDTVGLVGRLEAVEGLIGTPAEDYNDGTLLSRLDALENLVTGGEGGEGDEDQTLLQKVNANFLAIQALQGVVGDNTKGLVLAVNTLNADVNTVGSVDYKINEAFKWVDVQ